MPTLTLVPGSFEPEPDPAEAELGIEQIEMFLKQRSIESHIGVERIKDVGSAVRALESQGVPRGLGSVAGSAYVTVQRSQPVEVSPGVYYF